MSPGLSEAECQVAAFRSRQLVTEGQRQQRSAGARRASGLTRVGSGSVRRHGGALLVCAGLRRLGVPAVTREGLVPPAPGELGASA